MLVHGQVTIIFVVSVCLSCLFVQFYSAVFNPISIQLGHMLCLGLVVQPPPAVVEPPVADESLAELGPKTPAPVVG